jgi:hypothetical protein
VTASRQGQRGGASPLVVSPRWIAAAFCIAVAGAALCVWAALCLIFWLGSWQLLYHPKSAIAQTPASAGLQFDSIDFATTETGQPQLHGWWIPGPPESRFTAIDLHGANGNIGDVVPALAQLHDAKLNLLVFDYRGYGTSRFERPSEKHWREDADSAVRYLTETRHIPGDSIVLTGSGLGANLALEVAALHPEIAGVVLDDPAESPEEVVFRDPRARFVPAHLLVEDRWDLLEAAATLNVPSLWFESQMGSHGFTNKAYDEVEARKTRVWTTDLARSQDYEEAVSRWLDELRPDRRSGD